jgi:hypothetical protein
MRPGIGGRHPLTAHLFSESLGRSAIDFERSGRNDNSVIIPSTLCRNIAKSDILDDAFDVAFVRRTVTAATARKKLELAAGLDPQASRLLVPCPVVVARMPDKRRSDVTRPAAE